MTNENPSRMGLFISALRKEQSLTQKELADQLGVTDKAVSKWERGLGYPDISLLSNLAEVLGVTTSELLNGGKAESAPPAAQKKGEVNSQFTGAAEKKARHKARWKHTATGLGIGLLSLLIYIGCNAVIEGDLRWIILPQGITTAVLVIAILGAYVAGKNKTGALLLCGAILYLTTHYYSTLNASPARITSAAGSFPKVHLPHYTIEIILLVVSIALIVVTLWVRNKNQAGDIRFLLSALSVTILILSLLTVSAMIDYVDLNGLGVDPRFTVLTLFTILINLILLTIWARRHLRQSTMNAQNGQRV